MKVFLGVTEQKLGEVLRRYRCAHNFTQKKVADYLDIDRTTYTKYETVRKPEIDVIMKLAALYNVSVDEMLGEFFAESNNEITPYAKASGPENKELLLLDVEEKQLVLFYRDCVRKAELIEKAKEIWLGDLEMMEDDEQ